MARNDILPFRSPRGGITQRAAYPISVGASFESGEPIVLLSTGRIDIAGSDPAAVDGIAAGPSGSAAYGTSSINAPNPSADSLISVQLVDPEQQWICGNFATDGAGTPAVPTRANAMGELSGLILIGGSWFIDTGATNTLIEIVEILDANKVNIFDPNQLSGAGAFVVFHFV